ncbi:glycosyltransferase family 4 protein [Pseudokineococcus sp. 1T1Z-3]|uniref:glycosyltransferase family 4 protein n=1 Tax=Pseudokineococcus sp. 1T1Z-3 TaxID=3132745 RepID=UPI0030A7E01F
MRVLLLAGHATGGVAGHVADLAGGLAAAGVQRVVATSALTAGRWGRLGAVEEAAVQELWPDLWHPVAGARRLRRLRALARGADVVHAHGHQAGLLAALLLRPTPRRRRGRLPGGPDRAGRPVLVVTWHNAVLGPDGPGRALRALAERLQARRADLLTGASGDLVERARQLGARHAELTPVAVPDAVGQTEGPPGEPARAAQTRGATSPPPPPGLEDVAPGTPLVLTVSRVAPQKDLPTLVRAAARTVAATAQRGGPPALWCVVGDGDPALGRSLRRQVEALGAPVRFLGARDDVPALLARADVLALSSTWEARSLAVQEAMAAGLPVVATRTGGLPDLLEGVGALVPVGDDRALAEEVGALLADPRAREAAGRASREAFLALPRRADVLRGWVERYARLAGAGR